MRPLTQAPYVNGPDGFGSGQRDGMLAGMADGSVRFLGKDTDPRVLEQLASINGPKPAPKVASVPNPAPRPIPAPAPDPKPEVEPVADKPVKPLAPPVDVAARLQTRIPAIDFRETELADFLEFLSQFSGVRITLDVEALSEAGLTPDTKISVRQGDTTMGAVLEAALADVGLTFIVEKGQLLVTNPRRSRQSIETRTHDVSDLLGAEPKAASDFAAMVTELVEPESWRSRGGPGRIELGEGKLVVVQSKGVQSQIASFCDKLRVARGRRPRNADDNQPISLDSLRARAKQKLSTPLTVNFVQPAPLPTIVQFLRDRSEANILLDGLSLRAEGVTDDTEITLTVTKGDLLAALEALCGSAKIAYRIVDANTFQLTSRKSAAAQLDLEFYPIADLVANADEAAALMDEVRQSTGGPAWRQAGGRGLLRYDAASRYLIVLQDQQLQFQTEDFLAKRRAAQMK